MKVEVALEICHRISQLGLIVSRVISDVSGVQKWNHAEAAHDVWVRGGFVHCIRKTWLARRCQFDWECPTVADILSRAESGVPMAEWPAPQQGYYPRIVRGGAGPRLPAAERCGLTAPVCLLRRRGLGGEAGSVVGAHTTHTHNLAHTSSHAQPQITTYARKHSNAHLTLTHVSHTRTNAHRHARTQIKLEQTQANVGS